MFLSEGCKVLLDHVLGWGKVILAELQNSQIPESASCITVG